MVCFPFCLESWICPHECYSRQSWGKHHTTAPLVFDFSRNLLILIQEQSQEAGNV